MMKRILLTLNSSFLFLCVSMYLGTGWSMVLFSFPMAPQLTVDTYFLPFVLPVEAATRFFTTMTKLMMVSCLIMIVAEWKTRFRWLPIFVFLLTVAATVLTIYWIFPHNKAMREGITDPAQLQQTLSAWMALNKVRVGLWTAQWVAMMSYFAVKSSQPSTIS
jgi:hypothetical protein